MDASATRRKQNSDCATMWSLLFNSMDKTIDTKVLNNRRYDDAYLTTDILWLWQIMHLEGTSRGARLSAGGLLSQLVQVVRTGAPPSMSARSAIWLTSLLAAPNSTYAQTDVHRRPLVTGRKPCLKRKISPNF